MSDESDLAYQMRSIKLKEPVTPPYSMMVKNQHMRSNSWTSDNSTPAMRPRAYSSSVFDFDYVPKLAHTPLFKTPKQPPHPRGHGQVTPPSISPIQFGPKLKKPQAPLDTPSEEVGEDGAAAILAQCRDQKGCRSLQHRLQEGNAATIATIFRATAPSIASLMVDPFGNYFCQKLVEHCTEPQLLEILRLIKPKAVEIAVSQHGTRALQKVIEKIRTQQQVDLLVESLDGSVVHIVRDINGNHVIQKCLVCLDSRGVQFIYDSIYCNVISVGTHRHGCCVLQRCLDSAAPANKRRLVSQIVAQCLQLVRDPFGNYVCQYVLALRVPDYTHGITSQIIGHLSVLSTQKFSSNVVEKCLWTAEPEHKQQMTAELLEEETLLKLLLDPYGNYVIQTVLESSRGQQREEAVAVVQAALSTTRTPYGRRIMSKLKSL